MTILVYEDYVFNRGLLRRSLVRYFGRDNVEFCDLDDLHDGVLTQAVDIFVMPGGYDLYYMEKIDNKAAKHIKTYVENGGCYLGICAGAYFACNDIEWALGHEKHEIKGPRPLGFYPGKAIGPVYDIIEEGDVGKSWDAATTISYDDGNNEIETLAHYSGGPLFVPEENQQPEIKILARYTDLEDQPPAIVEMRHGRGKAVLCSPHLEYTYEGMNKKIYKHLNRSYEWERAAADALKPDDTSIRKIWAALLDRCLEKDTEEGRMTA